MSRRQFSWAVSFVIFCLAAGLAFAAVETRVYPFEDFEGAFVPEIILGRSEAKGSAAAELDNVHGGRRAARLQWNLLTCPTSNGFVNYFFQRQLLGQVKSVRAWVYTPQENVGTSMRLWLEDATGQIFISSNSLYQAGWHEYSFKVFGIGSPWKSGAGDNVQHMPLKLRGFAIEQPGTSGYVLIDDIRVETKGENRELIQAKLTSTDDNFIGWGQDPAFQLLYSNYASTKVELLLLSVTAADRLTGRELWSDVLLLPDLTPGKTEKICLTPEIGKFANYVFKYETSDDKGVLAGASGSAIAASMFGRAAERSDGPAQQKYAVKWDLPGGVFWQCTPQRGRDAGAVWARHWTPWSQIEKEPGVFDFSAAIARVDQLKENGLDLVYFNTRYEQPKFYPNDQAPFSAAYGKLHRELARAMGERINWYELGNEDNGPSKFLYTEMARNGYAGVRSENPYALIANSGTAQIDTGWLRMQAKRGLFQRLDALVTHPYSWTSPPEKYGVLEQLADVEQIIDDLGGMKFQYTTEFGYDHHYDQEKRANWIPRHFAIGAAAGLLRHGLFSWDGHFGIYDNGKAFPAAVSVNAYANLTRNHQFAGWLKRDDQAWVCVFQKAGEPLLMAWTPSGRGSYTLPEAETSFLVRDRDGNVIAENQRTLALSESPVYVEGLSSAVTLQAWQAAAADANARYKRVLAKSQLASDEVWSALAARDVVPFADLAGALLQWRPKTNPLLPAEQAVIAQTLRRATLMAHMEGLSSGQPDLTAVDTKPWENWRAALAQEVADDVDQPSLRWLLWTWEKVNDETAMTIELEKYGLARSLAGMNALFAAVAENLYAEGEKLFFPIWPYLYASADKDQPLDERLQFVPDRPVSVLVRLNSYSEQSYNATASLQLPEDWSCEPESWQGEIEPGQTRQIEFMVTAGNTVPERIYAALSVPDKPEVRIPYDDFEVLPALGIEIPVLSQFLPNAPLKVKIKNYGQKPISGKVRLLLKPETSPLATVELEDLAPEGETLAEVRLPAGTQIPDYNKWVLYALFTAGDGKQSLTPITVDFDAVARAGRGLEIDGQLNEWLGAAPLNLNREEYTFGTFGAGWSKEDLSGIVYSLWDDEYYYIAVDVKDQLFQQDLTGGDVWNQDSVQIAIAPEGGPITEFSLALTPNGPQVWRYDQKRAMSNARLAVKLLAGRTVYECAIPWSEMSELKAQIDAKRALRFDILLNDHDAIVSRRAMGRYGIGILHSKDYNLFGYLHFLNQTQPETSNAQVEELSQTVLSDDFNEYDENTTPDLWKTVVHLTPPPEILVKDGVGRSGSKALVFNNPEGQRPYYYRNLVREVKGTEAGQTYILQAWVKGSKVKSPGSVLGICSDIFGNEGQSYAPAWQPTDQWQLIRWEFQAPSGRFNVIIRNSNYVENLVLDDLKIIKKE